MKKAILLLFCFYLVGFAQLCNGQAPQHVIDSLTNVLKTAKEDTNKVNALNTLGEKTDEAGDKEKAKKYAESALELSQKLKYKKGEAAANDNIAFTYYGKGGYNEALKYFLTSLDIKKQLGDKEGVATSNNFIGVVNVYLGNSTEALKYLLASLKVREELGNKKQICGLYNNIGAVNRQLGNNDEALKYYRASLKMGEEMNNKPFISAAQNNIGVIYDNLGNFDEALKSYLSSLKISEEIGDKTSASSTINNIGSIYLKKKNYPEGLKYLTDALKTSKQLDDKIGISRGEYTIGLVYLGLKKNSEARKYFDDALTVGKEIGSKECIYSAYEGLSQLDSAEGNYKQSLANYKMYVLYKDSIFNATSSKQNAEMKEKYESEKKEKEIALLTKDNEIQNIEINKQKQLKYSFIGGLTLVILLLLFGYRAYRARQILRLQDIRNKIAGDLHDDIGSTLNSISIFSEVAKKNDEQRDEALEMIGDSSRKIIDVMSDIVWTINPENDNFAKIIFRMKSLAHNLLRAKNIEYTFHANEALDEKKLSLEERRNFYLIFKEAINNIVKYSNASRVAINLSNENDHLKLNIKDNGVGFDMSAENAGNGLKSMKRRADEMKAKFKIESQLGSGTQIELILTA